MTEIRKCDDNDRFYEGKNCPDCGAVGSEVLDSNKRTQVSKFLSGLLRHFPEDFDVNIDDEGWANTGDVIGACKDKYGWIDSEMILAVVATDPKGRFEVEGYRIRASYGHSVDYVTLEDGNSSVPDVLYHGTDPDNVESILGEGLKPMNRNHVHMTDDVEEARNVAVRHTDDPTILAIDAESMLSESMEVTKRATYIYTADEVPSRFISKTNR